MSLKKFGMLQYGIKAMIPIHFFFVGRTYIAHALIDV